MQNIKHLRGLASLLVFIICLTLVGCSNKTSSDTNEDIVSTSQKNKVEDEVKKENLPLRWEVPEKSLKGKIGETIEIPNDIYITDKNFSGETSSHRTCVSSDNNIIEPLRGDKVYLKHPGTATITMSLVVFDDIDYGSQDIKITVEEPNLGNSPYIACRNANFLEYKGKLYLNKNSYYTRGSFIADSNSDSINKFSSKLIGENTLANYNAYKDIIYFTDYMHGDSIYAMDLLGDNVRKIGDTSRKSGSVENMLILDDKIYYLVKNDVSGYIECMSLDGEILKKSSSYWHISGMQYYNGSLYFNARMNDSDDLRMYKTDLDFNEVEDVRNDLDDYKLYNGAIYYYHSSQYNDTEKNGIYRYDLKNKETTKIVDGFIGHFDILKDKIYFTKDDLFNSNITYNNIGHCNVDGSELKFLDYDDYYHDKNDKLGYVYSTGDKLYIFVEGDMIYVFDSNGKMSIIN